MKLFPKLSYLSVIICSLLFTACGNKEPIATFTVDAKTNKYYTITSKNITDNQNPTLTLKRGETYKFDVVVYNHPFYIKTQKTVGKSSTYDEGVTNNGANESVLLFSVPKNAPSTLYYVCQYHKMMSGELKIID